MEPEKSGLRRELSFLESIALSIGIMAPTAAMALNGSLAAGITGSAVPLAFLIATIAVGLASFSFIQFSRYLAHSGSVYAFNGIALGPRVGFFSGWALLGTYLAFTGASTAEVGNFAQAFFAGLGWSVGWLPLALIAGVLIWFFAYSRITISTRLTLAMEGVSVLLIVVLAVVILVRLGSLGQLSLAPFTPSAEPFNSVALAAVFGFLSFAGFEGAATLGEETRNPRRNIPVAILAAVFGTGFFYIVVTYAQTVGFGLSQAGISSFAHSAAPFDDLARRYVGRLMAVLLDFGATISAFASALGTANAGARILYAMGRDGFITERLGTASRRSGSPALAVAVIMLFDFAVVSIWGLAPGMTGATLFGYLGTIGVFLILVAYGLTNVGAIWFFFLRRRLWSWQWVIPLLAIIFLGYTLYSNIYPVPAPPYNIFPYVALAWLLLGLLCIVASPGLAQRIGLHLEENEGLRIETAAEAPAPRLSK
ncbi:APC family permease [Thermogemmatispora carboxidivorans]|uniref:APC family permease n=1 Tax=Thermogemmatispora carboxidivorans TaxID=1382306 RepID=UPI00069B56C1|nr:APC family permease [Thermogemmatispora carboxidivorans]